nr:MAG: hypothetical protein [Bacteriophage sp.]
MPLPFSYTLLIIGAKIGKNMAFFAVFQPTTKRKVGTRQNFFKLFAFLPKSFKQYYRDMTKEELAQMNEEGGAQQAPPAEAATDETSVDERPNRTAFSKRFSNRHSDIDFEDKEARYAAMNDDADLLGQYEQSGKALSKVFDKHKWLAALAMDMEKNPDDNPFDAMARLGIDVKTLLDDPEGGKKLAEILAKHNEDVAEQNEATEKVTANMRKSLERLMKLYPDDAQDMWSQIYEIHDKVESGDISDDIWKMLHNANNYDSDISSARDEAAMQARNEKIQNKVRSSSTEGIPPSLSSSGAGNKPAKKQKRESFFDDIRSN